MFKMYCTNMETNITEETKEFTKGNWINMVSPSEEEIKEVCENIHIQEDFLTGTMDAYASIISNNLNGVMKYLTSITIILAIPTMIASYWGMNVPVPLQDNPLGFTLIVILSILIGVLASLWLKKKGMLD